MSANYWKSVLDKRISRRRAIAATGATAAGAALLAACGGSSGSGSTGTQQAASLITKVVDESKDAKRGGTLKHRTGLDIISWDPYLTGNYIDSNYIYSGLLQIKDGFLDFSKGEVGGDVAQSWELSPDKLTFTAKINTDAHFAPLAPVNGRAVDAQDVVFSWERFKTVSTSKGDLANDVNPDAPVLSITAPDNNTVVIKLKEPNAAIFPLLAPSRAAQFFIVPKEARDQNVLDLRKTAIGSGPWYVSSYTASSNYVHKRNPAFKQDKGSDLPYVDTVEWPIIQEAAQVVAQFRTGNFYNGGIGTPVPNGLRVDDVLPIKKDIPALDLYMTDPTSAIHRCLFGSMLPTSPFKDERVRQAYVMTWDRDAFLDATQNVSKLRDAGVSVQASYESGLPAATYLGWAIDAKGDKNFGPNAKYFQQNVADAKKLLEAAGFASGVDYTLRTLQPGPATPASYFQNGGIDALVNFGQQSGLFRHKVELLNFATDYMAKYHTVGKGKFDGIVFGIGPSNLDPTQHLFAYYNPSGAYSQGTDDTMTTMTKKLVQEFDNEKRRLIALDIQRYEGGKMFLPRIGAATGVQCVWPAARNVMTFRGGTNRPLTHVFLDPTKAPLKSA